MRSFFAFLLIVVGLGALGATVTQEAWVAYLDPHQQNVALQDALPTVRMGLASFALVCVGGGLFVLWRGGGAAERWREYLTALNRLAAENGQTIHVDRRTGLEFLAYRDGQRIHVHVTEGPPAALRVRGIVPGRQVLSFVRNEEAVPDPTGRSVSVGGGKGWQLHAELPAIARTLLNDVVMVSMMDRFFAHTESRAIVHDASGVEVVTSLPTFDQAERRARQAIDIVSYLRRVNG